MKQEVKFVGWVLILGVAAWLEKRALKTSLDGSNYTFSGFTRRVFFTHRLSGKVLFSSLWTALYLWYLKHILEGEK